MAQPKRRQNGGADVSLEGSSAPNVVPIRIDSGVDPLDSFKSEAARAVAAATVATTAPAVAPAIEFHAPVEASRAKRLMVLGVCVAAAGIAVGALYVRNRLALPPVAEASQLLGRATLNSRPDGAAVLVDGASRGVTPLELELSAGTHDVVFRAGSSERHLTLKVESGARVSENVDMPAPVAAAGVLEIVSDPSGARVTIDGAASGTTPLTVRNVSPARHIVSVSQGGASVNRTVDVAAGATASVFVSLAQQPTGGSMSAMGAFAVDSPLELRIFENGQLLGVSNGAPIALPAGKHQFDFVNEALELRVSRPVSVESSKTARVSIAVPNGTLAVNASPWAEVFVDGKTIGVTPLGAISVPVGSHEIVWRHPQLGEKRRTVVVGAQTAMRVSMDLSK